MTAETPSPLSPTLPIMGDFVFGGIENDDARLIAVERARWSGIRHEYALEPRDPRPGEPVTLCVRVGPDTPVDHLVAWATFDNQEPSSGRGSDGVGAAFAFARAAVHWQPLIWSYVEEWRVTLPPQPAGAIVRYIIEGWMGDGPSHWCRELALDGAADSVTRYAFVVDVEEPPAWARDAVIYQIFVDRFRDHRRGDEEQSELSAEALRSFWGGSLRGVIESLEWIAALGANTLWLTPFFRTSSYHGYDVSDYYAVDPRFGSLADVRELVEAAHARNMRVLLDLVVNHTGLDYPPFVAARADADAPKRAWFSWGAQYTHGYRTFFNVRTMPQLNLDHPAAREAMCDVARYWLREFDVDGFRLDYAAGPSLAFWSVFRRACREAKPNCWLLGEVTRTGDALRAYAGRLDGCLDFGFAREVRRLVARPDSSLSSFAAWYVRSRSFFGSGFSLPSFLDNHDMNRFLWVVGGDRRKLRFGLGLLLALGESPVLYYGTEVGMGQPRAKGPQGEESRHPMLWAAAAQDAATLAHTRAWITARREHAPLVTGTLRTLLVDDARRIWMLERATPDARLLLLLNAGDVPQPVELPSGAWVNREGRVHRGTLEAPGWSVTLLTPAP